MPTFCRHNRFIERCPICRKELAGSEPPLRARASTRARAHEPRRRGPAQRAEGMRVRHEARAHDDGYRSALLPGLRSSEDARRLAAEIAFSSARLAQLEQQPPGLYGEARALAREDPERASWIAFLIAYLSPLEGEDPFAGIRMALDAGASLPGEVPLGPRTSHDPARGTQTLAAYRRFAAQAGSQQAAIAGDSAWSPERRFARALERLALPGFSRAGRYELLVLHAGLGLAELRADSLGLAGTRAPGDADLTALAAKRVFGIGDPLLIERRAAALADALEVRREALELALWNWAAPQRATLGFPSQLHDAGASARADGALSL